MEHSIMKVMVILVIAMIAGCGKDTNPNAPGPGPGPGPDPASGKLADTLGSAALAAPVYQSMCAGASGINMVSINSASGAITIE